MPYPFQPQSVHHALNTQQNQGHSEALARELESCKRMLEDLIARPINSPRQTVLTKILVKENKRLIIIRIEDVDWIEAWGDYLRLHCRDKSFIVHKKIGDVELRLDAQQFLRIGRSAIVNVDRIKELEPLNHGDYLITLSDSTQLNLSRNYRDRLIALFEKDM
ncbi:MAG: LytTR family transcriptional regulator [Ignavibacteriae bacterium]|nr:MAG: LytTR family transcriptional regulator [Ignavibacteriota bacterium]